MILDNKKRTYASGSNSPQGNITGVKFYDTAEDERLKYAVIISRSKGKWVFCKHRERSTLECPGGHREKNEAIEDTAVRELKEETGAIEFSIRPVCVYCVVREYQNEKEESLGMLYFAEIDTFEEELHSEIEKIVLLEGLPKNWTYPLIQPALIEEVKRRRLL
ncbi:MAG: NUDIX domain-containing protein [Eubacteriales bacterium]|nr:NUDIX domain-containing protein [Eubacteriales bacterium]